MKRILCIALVLILLFVLTGCGDENEVRLVDGTPSPLLIIKESECLWYDANTKIVYIIFKDSCGSTGYGYMSPYYAPNGLPYRYDPEKQELVMIGE